MAPPGGETGADIVARALPAIERIVKRHPEGNVLVVSHKATVRLLLCAFLGIDLNLYRSRIAAPVASLAVVEFRDTGPFVRNDWETVDGHAETIGARRPQLLPLYGALAETEAALLGARTP